MNLCTACGHDFAGVAAFDRHRVGKHAFTYSEGLKLYPPREDGRRCLHETEMVERGFTTDKRGRWIDAKSARSRTREGGYSLSAVAESSGAAPRSSRPHSEQQGRA